jgi:porin
MDRRCVTLLFLLLAPWLARAGDGGPDWQNATLSGDWGGRRAAWASSGVTSELLWKGSWMDDAAGGMNQGSDFTHDLEMKLGLDTAKLWGIPDSRAFIQVLVNGGGKINATHVGSLMGVDNLEVPDNGAKLYHAWFSKGLFDSKLDILAGVYPVDSEFYVTDSSGVFVHPSFGMAAEVAQTGRNGPSIYPISGTGLRVRYQPNARAYVQAAILDGDPGDGRNPHWEKINPIHGDGAFFIAELGGRLLENHELGAPDEQSPQTVPSRVQVLHERYEAIGKFAVGYWKYTEEAGDLNVINSSGLPIGRSNHGAYGIFERTVYQAPDMERDAAVFVRYGRAAADVNVFDYSASAGLRIRGLIAGRADDFFGVGVTRAHASGSYVQSQAAQGVAIPEAETAVELTYRTQIKGWLVLQPVLQRIEHPGLDPATGRATVIGLRAEVTL